jgi:hypothetical protein
MAPMQKRLAAFEPGCFHRSHVGSDTKRIECDIAGKRQLPDVRLKLSKREGAERQGEIIRNPHISNNLYVYKSDGVFSLCGDETNPEQI